MPADLYAPVQPAVTPEPQQTPGQSKRAVLWKSRIDESIEFIREFTDEWQHNVDYRRGKLSAQDDDTHCERMPLAFDWAATKSKQAQLFSQVPEVRLSPKTPKYAAGTPVFMKKLNDLLCRIRVGVAMDEVLPDVINAAGIGGVVVAYESRGEETKLPTLDPEAARLNPQMAQEMEGKTTQVYQRRNGRYTVTHFSPTDLLFPKPFVGSDFDDAPWIGHRGRTTWSDAMRKFRLKEEDRERVVGQDTRQFEDQLSPSSEPRYSGNDPVVEYQQIFYWRYLYHPEEVSFEALHHMVFVKGIDEPVIDEEWKGQIREGDEILGSCKPPVRILTLTHISGEPIPPSDSAVGRPQVDHLIQSRVLQRRQQETSLPMRWMNVNLVDPIVQANMLRGIWQSIIPLNGSGDKAVGEVARASYPNDNWHNDDIVREDLTEAWQISSNQLASRSGPAIRSAAEANIVQQNYQTRVGYERARVVNFFLGIAEVLAGLICVLDDFTPEERKALEGWDLRRASSYYAYDVRADASVLLDARQRYDQLERYLNLAAKSGMLNTKYVLSEMALLIALNPELALSDPPPPMTEPANVSIRGTVQEFMDPLSLGFLVETKQAPSKESIEIAKQLLMLSAAPPQPPPPPGAPGAPPPGGPEGATPSTGEDMAPDWNEASRIDKRSESGA